MILIYFLDLFLFHKVRFALDFFWYCLLAKTIQMKETALLIQIETTSIHIIIFSSSL